MPEFTQTILADVPSDDHDFRLIFSEKAGWRPQFKLRLSKTFNPEHGPEVLRVVTIPMRPAMVLAQAIIQAEVDYRASVATKAAS